jgi:hypothetical protein
MRMLNLAVRIGGVSLTALRRSAPACPILSRAGAGHGTAGRDSRIGRGGRADALVVPGVSPRAGEDVHLTRRRPEEGDQAAGTIYVVRSKSEHPVVAANRDLIHKIGVTNMPVEYPRGCGGAAKARGGWSPTPQRVKAGRERMEVATLRITGAPRSDRCSLAQSGEPRL